MVGAIFKNSTGQSHQSDSRSCTFEAAHRPNTDYSTINIYERICSIYVKPPFGNKIKGEAMAQKLGEVCTKLFALP